MRKGLNFDVVPNRILNEEIICDIEEGIKSLNDRDKDKVRQECTIILDKAKLPKKNLTSEQLKALKNLRCNDKIVILKANKGGATVVMEKEEYNNKMRDHLHNIGSYKKLNKNPIFICFYVLVPFQKS